MVRKNSRSAEPFAEAAEPLDPYLAEVDRTFERVKDEPLR